MANQIQCPRCNKSMNPVERRVIVWEISRLWKHVVALIVQGVTGIGLLVIGPIVFIRYIPSVYGVIGAPLVGILLLALLIYRMVQIARTKQRRQVCAVCGYYLVSRYTIIGGPEGLETYFTDVKDIREEFIMLTAAPTLPRRILIIHGMGGVGKSSLLHMFRLHCGKQGVPVALASGNEGKTLVAVLSDWARELIAQGITMPTYARVMNEYTALQKKAEERAQAEEKSQEEGRKGVIKAAVQVASIFIPSVSALSSVLGEGGVSDILVSWLRGFLSTTQIDLLLDPTEELTDAFLEDLVEAMSQAERKKLLRRMVLLLDTFEQMMALNNWVCDFARRLHPDVLLVIAGQIIPDWEQRWPGWHTLAKVEKLEPMSTSVMRELADNYYIYATQRGDRLDRRQVEEIAAFAHGLPLAVTTIASLAAIYGEKDFHAVESEGVAALSDQLMQRVPERIRPALEATAVLRWFNQDMLRVILGAIAPTNEVYRELRRFPFVLSRKDGKAGLALHDSVREHLNHNMRLHQPGRHRELHERAAAYFEEQLQTVKGEEAIEFVLENLYHSAMANEEEGIKQFRKAAEELVSYQLLSQLRTLLNDLDNYPLQRENSRLWRKYYQARLMDLEGQHADAVPTYLAIADKRQAEEMLRMYALCDIVWAIGRTDIERKAQLLERIRKLFPEPDTLPEPDAKLGLYLLEVSELYQEQGRCTESLEYLERAQRLYERMGDLYWLAFTHNQMKYYYLNRGMWVEAAKRQQQGLQEIEQLVGEQQQSYLEAELLAGVSIGWMWAGRYHKTEQDLRNALSITEQFGRQQQRMYFLRDLALVLGLQGKAQEATDCFTEAIELGRRQQDKLFEAITQGFQGMVALKWSDIEQGEMLLAQCLEGLRQHSGNRWDSLTFLYVYGMLHEVNGNLAMAEQAYRDCLDMRQFERWYWHIGALSGLARIQYARGVYDALVSLVQEAETMVQQYEHNDHLAVLRLLQGHLAWDGRRINEAQGFDTALQLYQQALIYALRYNRFLLDEVLSGRPADASGTLVQPIVPHCLERGEEGRRMLLALSIWWQSGMNDVAMPRPESISPIREGVSLLEGESRARLQEPGDGTPQRTVLEQLAHIPWKEKGDT